MAKKTKEQIDRATTQEHIPVGTIRDGIIITKDGDLRIVLLVGAINFALKSQEEQNAIIYQYQSFINSLTFPIQILVQSRIMDLTNYLKGLNDTIKHQTNELLIEMSESYIDFVTGLISEASIMNKRFYVIIPVKPIETMPQPKSFGKLFGKNKKQEITFSDKDFEHYQQLLLEHAQTVSGGLSAIGLQVAVLNTQQVVELLYSSYNPEEGVMEKLTDVEDLETNIVQEDPSALQQQMIKNVFAQKYGTKNGEDPATLNISKQAPPVLGGPVPTDSNINQPQNNINQSQQTQISQTQTAPPIQNQEVNGAPTQVLQQNPVFPTNPTPPINTNTAPPVQPSVNPTPPDIPQTTQSQSNPSEENPTK